jgi:hypothetical protein
VPLRQYYPSSFFDPSIARDRRWRHQSLLPLFLSQNPFRQTGTATAPTNYWLSVKRANDCGRADVIRLALRSYDYYNDVAVWGIAPFPAAWTPMIDPQGNPLSMAFQGKHAQQFHRVRPGSIICPAEQNG